jgi:cytochrome d ubiquinol oxidase subunit II
VELADAPAILILIGITAYAVLAGADFGAPIWALWNPLILACLGIIMRAVGYVAGGVSMSRTFTWLAAAASLLVPFALGTVIGAIVDGRVPPGNASGALIGSWLAPVPVMIGLLLVASSAYLAAVYLAADAGRTGEDDLASAFRARGLVAGLVAGLLAGAGLIVLEAEVSADFFDGLTSGLGLVAVLISAAAGLLTLGLLWFRRFSQARYMSALAVAAVVAGWGIAQQPDLLPGLTVHQAAASDEVIIGLLVAVAIGLMVLIPSLYLLYGLVLGGRFDPLDVPPAEPARDVVELEAAGRPALVMVIVLAGVGGLLLFTSSSGFTLYFGLALFMAGLVSGIMLLARSLVRSNA